MSTCFFLSIYIEAIIIKKIHYISVQCNWLLSIVKHLVNVIMSEKLIDR